MSGSDTTRDGLHVQGLETVYGSVLALPITDVRSLTRGVNLEGVGVAPTIEVPDAALPYREGADPILEAGLREAAKLARRVAVPF